MTGKFVLAVISAFVVYLALGYLFHNVILGPDYAALAGVYRRPEAAAPLFPVMLIAMLILASGMVALYSFGVGDKPWLPQGLRFGAMIASVSVIPVYMIGFVVTNVTAALAAKQVVFETISTLAVGVVIAWFFRR